MRQLSQHFNTTLVTVYPKEVINMEYPNKNFNTTLVTVYQKKTRL